MAETDMFRARLKNDNRDWVIKVSKVLPKCLGWHLNDTLSVGVNFETNALTIKNVARKPVGLTWFLLALNNYAYLRGKKKYIRQLKTHISPDGKAILAKKRFKGIAGPKLKPSQYVHRCKKCGTAETINTIEVKK